MILFIYLIILTEHSCLRSMCTDFVNQTTFYRYENKSFWNETSNIRWENIN